MTHRAAILSRWSAAARRLLATVLAVVLLAPLAGAAPLTLSFRQTPIEEVFEMLSREARVNILLGQGVTGLVSLNLYNVELDAAIRDIAEAGGFVAEDRGNSWMVMERDQAGRDSALGNTIVRSFKVQYTDAETVAEVLTEHLSRYGRVTSVPERNLLVIEELPGFMVRLEAMLGEIDVAPRQILIEAKILEITLDSSESYGIDWSAPLSLGTNGSLDFGQRGIAPLNPLGFFFNVVTPDFEAVLRALSKAGRVRTLSTPRLLVMEHQPAEVVIGDRLGYSVTTTINQVTTESVEYLESGVILRVTAAVDRSGRVLLSVHPEVSTGTINDGIPSQQTTEVTTEMLADDGQKIFIGGLIRNTTSENRRGIPVLGDLPILGHLFSSREELNQNTETVVLITPHLVEHGMPVGVQQSMALVDESEQTLNLRVDHSLSSLRVKELPSFEPTAQRVRPSRLSK